MTINIETPGDDAAAMRSALQALRQRTTGALVYITTTLTTQNFSSLANLPFNGEDYDDAALHDNVTNNARLVVPAGFTRARYYSQVDVYLATSGQSVILYHLRYNSSNVVQASIGLPMSGFGAAADATAACNAESSIIPVSAGDYFVTGLFCTDTSITIGSARSWAALELWP